MPKRCRLFFFLGNSFYCFSGLYCFSCLTVKPPLTDAKTYEQLGIECQRETEGHSGKNPAWSFQPLEHLTLPGAWDSTRIPDNIQGHLGKGIPPAEIQLSSRVPQEAWAFCSFIQSSLPYSGMLGITLFLKESPNSATILLEVPSPHPRLSWL